jgi:dTDP-4-dehydrorhamnose 3,5-epimerase
MKVERLAIPDVVRIVPRRFIDGRGHFSETYNQRALSEHGIDMCFVQDNQSVSLRKGTLRGIHFQRPPHGQVKLVRCTRGSILDVAVDLRSDSTSYGRHVSTILSEENGAQLFVPVGFGHGFLTLEDDCHVQYKVSAFYAPEADAGIRWDDAELGIDWGVEADRVLLSDKDRALPSLKDAGPLF